MDIMSISNIDDISIGKIVSVGRETINGNWNHVWSKPVNYHKLTFVLKGSSNTSCNNINLTTHENDILYAHTRNFSSNSNSDVFSYICIYFTIFDEEESNSILNEPILFKSCNHLKPLFQAIYNEYHKAAFSNKLKEKRLLYEILEGCSEQKDKSYQISGNLYAIKKAVEAIENEFSTDLTVEYLAELCNYTPAHFISLFRKVFNTTPKNYIISKRMEKAKELLLSTNEPVLSVAEKVGYSTFAHFSAEFKRHTGYSPLNYRKTYSFTVIP